VFCIVSTVFGLPNRHRNTVMYEHASFDLLTLNFTRTEDSRVDVSKVVEKTISQPLDHFNVRNTDFFKQRYFIDETYWSKAKDAPVFLCVGGEGPPLDKSVLVSSVHCNDMVELAATRGALMFALEHRYYGVSMPSPGDYSIENLRGLTTEQALEDISMFVSSMNEKYALTSSNRWVTWGGSYPGMMAAMARLRNPNLVYACVSSSSPLQAAVDFPGYNNVVAHSVANPDVGGSSECLAVVVDGHKEIGELLKSESGRRQLEQTFNLCDAGVLEDTQNREQFAGDGVIYLPVQSNDPSCTTPNCNIGKICSTLLSDSSSSSMQRLANYAKSATCASVSYTKMIESMANPKNPSRSWLYQTCSEWGFYQTCNVGTECPYTQGLHDLSVDYDICLKAFGLSKDQVDSAIKVANIRYGGAGNFQSTRVMFPNGEIDPWTAGGIQSSPAGSVEEPAFLVKGASHHFWTHPSLATDSAEVNEARQTIWKQVNKWLDE